VSRTKSKLAVYAIIVVLPFLLLFARFGPSQPLKNLVVKNISLPLRIILFPFQEAKKILFYHRIYNEYLRLTEEVNILKGRLVGWEEVARENNRLAQLLKFQRKLLYTSIAANVVGRDPSNWNATLIIDKGRQDDVDVGMPVVNAMGIVGKVAEVQEDQAKVILVTDPSFSVAAVDQRSREVGLVAGTLRGLCRMRYLSGDADVNVNDTILTSKISSSFPEGLLIGEVIQIESQDNAVAVNCLIKPAVTLSQIEEVLVIKTE